MPFVPVTPIRRSFEEDNRTKAANLEEPTVHLDPYPRNFIRSVLILFQYYPQAPLSTAWDDYDRQS